MKLQDRIAGAMAIILLLAIIALIFIEREIPSELWAIFGIATGWVFSRGVNGQINGVTRRRTNGE
ncbi:hypothetical protein LCGC14_2636230 [marine sediment metagenome]|uniref:Uncharacterized protein n=1 Tax=marine sediment metagenome TaxID=412755 RepID=A0A0F9C9P4_9ZZZZ